MFLCALSMLSFSVKASNHSNDLLKFSVEKSAVTVSVSNSDLSVKCSCSAIDVVNIDKDVSTTILNKRFCDIRKWKVQLNNKQITQEDFNFQMLSRKEALEMVKLKIQGSNKINYLNRRLSYNSRTS